VVMGVAGAGKSTVGRLLADRLGGLFIDGDDLHPRVNIEKMSKGIALTDADRRPWLDAVAKVIRAHDGAKPLVVACSALKKSYRRRLGGDFHLVYLKGTADAVARRLRDRHGHFMPRALLESQFKALEEPEDGLVVGLDQPPEEITDRIVLALS